MLLNLLVQQPQMLGRIIENTPYWVWALLAGLLWLGGSAPIPQPPPRLGAPPSQALPAVPAPGKGHANQQVAQRDLPSRIEHQRIACDGHTQAAPKKCGSNPAWATQDLHAAQQPTSAKEQQVGRPARKCHAVGRVRGGRSPSGRSPPVRHTHALQQRPQDTEASEERKPPVPR